jgi:ribose-phosphate pyrophosphokinase
MSISLQLNGYASKLEFFSFPGGERHVKINMGTVPQAKINKVSIYVDLHCPEAMVDMMLLNNAVKHLDTLDHTAHRTLIIPYLPYARQDRIAVKGEPLSLEMMSEVINMMAFDEVYVYDLHSDVSAYSIKNLREYKQHHVAMDKIGREAILSNQYVVCSPDGGALKKVYEFMASANIPSSDLVVGMKHRDVATGRISGTTVVGEDKVKGRNVLIIDDICDGGMTFIKLAEILKANGANSVHLYVTHGIFSKGKEVLHEAGIEKVMAFQDWTLMEK